MTPEPANGPPSLPVDVFRLAFTPASRPLALLPRAWLGATLRGAFLHALRDRECRTGAMACEGCPHIPECGFGALHELAGTAGETSHYDVPRPFVIDPPMDLEGRTIAPGEVVEVCIKLIGSASAHAQSLLIAARFALARGLGRERVACSLVEVEHLGGDCIARSLVATSGGIDARLKGPPFLVSPTASGTEASDTVLVRLDTPLLLEKRLPRPLRLDPGQIASRLAARLDALSRVYAGLSPVWDYRAVTASAQKARCVASTLRVARHVRFEGETAEKKEVTGIRGEATFTGVAPEVLALWHCARYVHVGRHTAFGFGRLVVEPLVAIADILGNGGAGDGVEPGPADVLGPSCGLDRQGRLSLKLRWDFQIF